MSVLAQVEDPREGCRSPISLSGPPVWCESGVSAIITRLGFAAARIATPLILSLNVALYGHQAT